MTRNTEWFEGLTTTKYQVWRRRQSKDANLSSVNPNSLETVYKFPNQNKTQILPLHDKEKNKEEAKAHVKWFDFYLSYISVSLRSVVCTFYYDATE